MNCAKYSVSQKKLPWLHHTIFLFLFTLYENLNPFQQVPESLEHLTSLVTLKLDDNQLEKLPVNLGRMNSLEELYVAENFLTYLPPSIGWLRRLHTLNVDENDLEELPPEIGSCRHMKILSVHGNKLSGWVETTRKYLTNLLLLSNIFHLSSSWWKICLMRLLRWCKISPLECWLYLSCISEISIFKSRW